MKKNHKKIKIHPKWIDYYEEDYKIVIKLFEEKTSFHRTICFHAQQFFEKLLKGILEAHDVIPPKTHDIEYLVNRVKELGYKLPVSDQDIMYISSIYFDTRYPPDLGLLPKGEPSKEDVERAYKISKAIHQWITHGK